jgi:tRNA 5-methylaminomethyl-2-thiouridine biosynthesis bifunctional protein
MGTSTEPRRSLGQAQQVFIGGTGLPERWRGREQFVVLETGFGLGTNFLATWQKWRDDGQRCRRLHFVSIERHPLVASDLVDAAPAELGELARELARCWPLPLQGLHRCEFEAGRVVLTLAFGDARELAPRIVVGADAIFLDGFAPDRNPEMWEPKLIRTSRCARPDALLATYTSARSVREALEAAGFNVELRGGYGGKRHRLVARFAPRYVVRRHEPAAPYDGERRGVVIGAGLAGAACAEALARRGWHIEVVDSLAAAGGASALPWGLLHPHFAADDNLLARLTRAGVALTTATLMRTAGSAAAHALWQRCGAFQQASSPVQAAQWCAVLQRQPWPSEHVQFADRAAAARLVGVAPAQPGLWFPAASVIAVGRCVAALLAAAGTEVHRASVGRLERVDGVWRVVAVDGSTIATAPVVVVAAAMNSARLLDATLMPMSAVAGQITLLDAPALASLRAGLGGDGTLLRAPDGTIAIGATFDPGESQRRTRSARGRSSQPRAARAIAGRASRGARWAAIAACAASRATGCRTPGRSRMKQAR